MKIHLKMEFEIDSKEVDGGSDIEWAVFNTIHALCHRASNTDEFFDDNEVKVEFTEEE